MPDYHAMYLKLFAAQADAIDALKMVTEHLIQAHLEVEEMLLAAPEPEIALFRPDSEEK